jgi:hypothetical protein
MSAMRHCEQILLGIKVTPGQDLGLAADSANDQAYNLVIKVGAGELDQVEEIARFSKPTPPLAGDTPAPRGKQATRAP